jgi:hypothetical protein
MLSRASYGLESRVGGVLDTNSSLIFVKQDANDFGLGKDMEIGIFAVVNLVMDIRGGSILSSAVLGNIPQPALHAVVSLQVLEICDLRPADLGCSFNEVAFRTLGTERAVRDLDRPVGAMIFRVTTTMVCFKLWGGEVISIGSSSQGKII